ncbi:MAG: BON domain-containing protein [Candidatus Azobacteroides sp.]|nr:BON domain-containing protein [Candidatus Azobacteroides sp.]
MKKLVYLISCVLIAGISFQSCGKSNDEKIKEEVNRELTGNYSNVTSTVHDGVITLNGTVDTQDMKNSLEMNVRNITNVKSVVNNVTVNNAAPEIAINHDNTLRSNLESQLNSAGYNDVRVDVRDGEVILTGDVKRDDLQRVMQLANETNPRKVTNQLTIK